MSSTSSAASGPSASASKKPGCGRSRSAKKMSSAAKSSKSTGRKSRATKTSPRLPPTACEQMALPLTSSQEGGRAKIYLSPEKALALTASEAAYGRSTPESFAKFDPATSSWKTSQLCLDGGLTAFSETWPRSFMTRRGTAYRLEPLVRRTFETESGLLPTPAAAPYGTSNNGCPGDGREEYATKGKPSLEMMARKGHWPTPTAADSHGHAGEYQRTATHHEGTTLATAVRMWPSPNASDANGPRTPEQVAGMKARAKKRKGGGKPGMTQLRDAVFASPAARDWRSGRGRSDNGHTRQLPEQIGGQLNPDWVEMLMGLPKGWTRLEESGDQDGKTAPAGPSRRARRKKIAASGSSPSATRSSRPSRRSSVKRL